MYNVKVLVGNKNKVPIPRNFYPRIQEKHLEFQYQNDSQNVIRRVS